MRRHRNEIDLSALVDIISNVAGMMILLACVAILVRQQDTTDLVAMTAAKPISFPFPYIPDKRSLTLCLKGERLYQLPEKEALEEISRKTEKGETVQWIDLVKNGVEARVELTPTFTGFRFQYRILPEGGVDLRNKKLLVTTLESILEEYPAEKFFYSFHTWPDSFEEFREIREFLHEKGIEVGWELHPDLPGDAPQGTRYDVIYSVGEYDEKLTTIKAQ